MRKIDDLEHYFIDRSGKVYSNVGSSLRELKATITKKGYLNIKIKGKTYKVHRLVALAYIPNPQNLPQVNHIDGNKSNNQDSNLEWVNNSENQLHAWKTGLQPVRHAVNTSLTQEQADAIRRTYTESDIGTSELARNYGVSKTTIKDILNAKYYNLDKSILPVSKPKTLPKFTTEQVLEIRKLYATGTYSYNKLGTMFGVNHKTIKKITDRISYKDIEGVTTSRET